MTAKDRIAKLVENIPDDASREEVLYRLRLFHSVELGLRDAEEGKLIDHDELFDELLGDEKEGEDPVDHKGKRRSSGSKNNHRPRQAEGGSEVRQKSKGIRQRS